MSRRPSQFVLALALLSSATAARPVAAQSSLLDDYIAAAQLARGGQLDAACDRLAELAAEHPASVAVHRAWGAMAVATGRAAAVEPLLRSRSARDAGDWAARVGLAALLAAQGRKSEGWRAVSGAVAAGERDPLIVPLLLETGVDATGPLRFLESEMTKHPRDALLAALAVRTALAAGRVIDARRILDGALARGLEHQELALQDAILLRAAGREQAACDEATLVGSVVGPELEVPELRVPRRVALARILLACGRTEPARRVLAALGPAVSFPGDLPLRPLARSAEAEWALAHEDPLGALALLDETPGLDETGFVREAALAVRAGALARLGVLQPGVVQGARQPLPEGLALADRAAALAALAATPGVSDDDLLPALERLASRLEEVGFLERAARVRTLAAWRLSETDPPGARRELRRALALLAGRGDAAPGELAAALLDARMARRAGDPAAALRILELSPLRAVGVPGALMAAARVEATHAALAAGDPERARALAREGMLDVQEAARGGLRPADEAQPIAGNPAERAVELAGLLFRAALGLGRSPEVAGGAFVHNLGRAARSWSLLEAPWPDDLARLGPSIPRDGCAVFAALGEQAPALAVGAGGKVEVTTPAAALSSAPCAAANVIYWAGPASAPGGLSPAPGDARLLLRWISPVSQGEGFPSALPDDADDPPPPIGPGPTRPRRRLVEELVGAAAPPDGDRLAGSDAPSGAMARWPIFVGAGLAPARAPLSGGWLVPPGYLRSPGWLGPESIQTLPPTRGPGLVALGLRALPGADAPESGLSVLADSALQAGWRWSLLAREPLAAGEVEAIRQRLSGWASNPYREARRLARNAPETAAKLTLWTVPARKSAREIAVRTFGRTLALLGAASIL
ncbi:MAG: hypothetical protein MUC67_09380, partial [Acidobacteria bacterium]|nr:hypothetical protein [Acidobacteriota bacterium]